MNETILTLAQALCGASEAEKPLLQALCQAAEADWTGRLRAGKTADGCGSAFSCAAAFTAVAGLLSARGGGDSFSSFTAGTVSVSARGAAETGAAADTLRREAERLMAPYVTEDSFCFCGVRG